MKTLTKILTGFLMTFFLTSCHDFGDRQNALYGIIFRDKKEVPQLKKYENIGGSVIDDIKDNLGNFKFGISHLTDSIGHILIFEQFVLS